MRKLPRGFIYTLLIFLAVLSGCGGGGGGNNGGSGGDGEIPVTTGAIIIDHRTINLNSIPTDYINTAKTSLNIAYGHTSHGSQIYDGMLGLESWKPLYAFNTTGENNGELRLRHWNYNFNDESGDSAADDLNQPNYTNWEAATRRYLAAHPGTNVIMWSWCGGADTSIENIEQYLSLMSGLERDFRSVRFVYMTGHLKGTGLDGNLHLRNEQIRTYCRNNGKILYDFADIERYNPDGIDFGSMHPDDGCNIDGGRNWAIEWQDTHIEGVDWYNCSSAHSQPINANMKAYAAWWLWARLAGWDGK